MIYEPEVNELEPDHPPSPPMPPSKQTTIEDDVDDLDDVLEQFNAPSTSTKAKEPAKAPKAPDAAKKDDSIDEDEFAKQFADEMEAFMKSLADPSGSIPSEIDPDAAKKAEALRKAWESLLVDDLEQEDETLEDATLNVPSTSTGTKSSATADAKSKTKEEAEDAFQNAVKSAMDKLKKSDESNKADLNEGDLSSLLSAFSNLSFDGEGGDGVQGVLETLMGQLMSKEILYEPLKELNDKFPEYLETNRSLISTEDQVRYDKQKSIISEVIAIFESPDYSDTNPATSAEIIKLMSEMQEYGSPPAEIMGTLPPGFDVGSDGLPSLNDQCIVA